MIGDLIHLWVISWDLEGFKVYLRKPLSGGKFSIMCKGRVAEGEQPADAAYRIAIRQISTKVTKQDLILLPSRVEGEHVFMLKKKFEHYNTGKIKGEITNVEISKLWNHVISERDWFNIDLYELAMVKAYINSSESDDETDETTPYEIAKLNIYHIANEFSDNNMKHIEKSNNCGCFNCLRLFKPSDIMEHSIILVSKGSDTAVCPYCGTDAVLGDYSGFPITKEFMENVKNNL